ncbi:MAG: hypothetical protein OJF47_004152 [Nitrospira sp.]|nr:MAG: hypothetical protein OJF47_004152 [Nitrospira sp.]
MSWKRIWYDEWPRSPMFTCRQRWIYQALTDGDALVEKAVPD